MVIMQMHPERNLFKYHLWAQGLHIFVNGFKVIFFLGEGLQPWGHFFFFTGKWAYNWGAYKLGGEGFFMIYCSLSAYLEWVIISYVAVLSYLEQWNVEWYMHCM